MRPLPTVSFQVQMSNVLQKQQHGGSQIKDNPHASLTREANTLRHTQVRTTCAIVATRLRKSRGLRLNEEIRDSEPIPRLSSLRLE